jgi:hypothetical protein
MRNLHIFCVISLLSCTTILSAGGGSVYPEIKTDMDAVKRFEDMRFGLMTGGRLFCATRKSAGR